MRNIFAKTFYEAAKTNPKLTMTVADISPAGAMNEFRTAFPERFINTGVAEQSMIGICAGQAMTGLQPFAYTIATFAVFRPFEFVRNDICYQDLPVTIVGIGGGVIYSTLGSTHHAQEDIAVMKCVPNLEIYAPCDPQETEAITLHRCDNPQKPAYIRLGKAGEQNLGTMDDFVLSEPRKITTGEHVCIVGYGPILGLAKSVLDTLEQEDIRVSLYSIHQLKPVNAPALQQLLHQYSSIIVLEEMSPFNGLYADFLVEKEKLGRGAKLIQISLKDEFIHCYGSHSDILSRHGISEETLYKQVKSEFCSSD